jgi:hypothetical protein
MGANKSVVISFSIAILLLLSLLLLLTYNSKCNNSKNNSNSMYQGKNIPEPFYYERFSNNVGKQGMSVADVSNIYANPSLASDGIGNFSPSDPKGDEIYSNTQSLEQKSSNNYIENNNNNNNIEQQKMYSNNGVMGSSIGGIGNEKENASSVSNNGPYASYELQPNDSSQNMQSCYPRDRLTADDLLPKDAADSKWARINPSGAGNIGDQNYLTAGYHVGINTVGQSLRNANLQLRSEIPNPQNAVGPWLISTIEPDLRQNTLEIGSAPSYY